VSDQVAWALIIAVVGAIVAGGFSIVSSVLQIRANRSQIEVAHLQTTLLQKQLQFQGYQAQLEQLRPIVGVASQALLRRNIYRPMGPDEIAQLRDDWFSDRKTLDLALRDFHIGRELDQLMERYLAALARFQERNPHQDGLVASQYREEAQNLDEERIATMRAFRRLVGVPLFAEE
jgi:hypothetical protein